MKKVFAAALAAALVGGLAAAALTVGASERTSSAHYGAGGDDAARAVARRASGTWEGKLKDSGPDTSIKIKSKTQGGEATELKSLRYKGLPADCEVTGKNTLDANPTLRRRLRERQAEVQDPWATSD